MRRKILTVVAAGAVGATGFAVAGPALASTTAPATAVVTSQVDRMMQALAGLVKDNTITQAQADKVAETLKSTHLGRGPGRRGGRGFGGHHGRGGARLTAAATALKMTETELRTALASGKTLAQVARDQGVSVNTLVAALVKAQKAKLDHAVKDGRLTQAQADARAKELRARITRRVDSTRPARPGHDGDGPRDLPRRAPGDALSSSTGTATGSAASVT